MDWGSSALSAAELEIELLKKMLADTEFTINSPSDQLVESEEEVAKYKGMLKQSRQETKAARNELKVIYI